MRKRLAIIDYGMGNLRSVINAFTELGSLPFIAGTPDELHRADAIVLPGVGAFTDGINNLKHGGLIEAMEEEIRINKKPFLGICLGMQLLSGTGTEYGKCSGFNWIPGTVVRIDAKGSPLRIPHIGWNEVSFDKNSRLFAGLESPRDFYFLHSYIFVPDNNTIISGRCVYGGEFAAAIESGNIYATQFHPEKSHRAGLAVLKNFLDAQ